MQPMVTEPTDSFRAKPSLGWLWVLAFVLFMVVPLPFAFLLDPPAPDEVLIVWLSMLPLGVLVAWFLAVVASLPRMRYELGSNALMITCGPLLRYRVPYTSISSVEVVDLRFSAWSSFRFPGLALWKVAYGGGAGQIRMCSTRSHRGVLLVTAGAERYGISPAEEDRFVHALKAGIDRAARLTAPAGAPDLR